MNVSDIIRLAASGGGFRIDCSKYSVSDLIRIANAASMGGGFIFLENTEIIPLFDKVRIASASRGHVIFNSLE